MSRYRVRAKGLREARKARGWTQWQAAQKMGVSLDYYRKVERGERYAGGEFIAMALVTFGAPFEELFEVVEVE